MVLLETTGLIIRDLGSHYLAVLRGQNSIDRCDFNSLLKNKIKTGKYYKWLLQMAVLLDDAFLDASRAS